MIDLPPPTHQQTIEAIAKCDIPPGNIRIQYEDYLQSDEITISNLGGIDEEKMRCLREAVHPFYILTITDQTQQVAFHEYARRANRPQEQADALKWVHANDRTEKLPVYSAGGDLVHFAAALETACGLKAGSALTVAGRSLSIRPEFIQSRSFEALVAPLECLMNLFAASDAAEDGVGLGFIGNQPISEENN